MTAKYVSLTKDKILASATADKPPATQLPLECPTQSNVGLPTSDDLIIEMPSLSPSESNAQT